MHSAYQLPCITAVFRQLAQDKFFKKQITCQEMKSVLTVFQLPRCDFSQWLFCYNFVTPVTEEISLSLSLSRKLLTVGLISVQPSLHLHLTVSSQRVNPEFVFIFFTSPCSPASASKERLALHELTTRVVWPYSPPLFLCVSPFRSKKELTC